MYSIINQLNNRKFLIYPESKHANNNSIEAKNSSFEQLKLTSTYFPEDIDPIVSLMKYDKVEIGNGNYIYHGDNIEVLKKLPDNSIDSCVTDPPYGLKFMNKKWDHDVPCVDFWKEVYRVIKPGGYILSFGGARTYHRMATNIEIAGFEIKDQIMWVYGSGFTRYNNLKPAHEPIAMAKKPFKGSIANNELEWNTGRINVDDCRIEFEETKNAATNPLFRQSNNYKMPEKGKKSEGVTNYSSSKNKIDSRGRKPANIIFDEVAGAILNERSKNNIKEIDGAARFFYCPKPSKKEREEGLINEACIINERDECHDNSSLPQRFRNSKRKNTHTTVKPVSLMQYLIRLVTPKGGITIDPFLGSGTSPKATIREGNYKFIGIEKEKEYFDISVARCQYEYNQTLKVIS
jgi:DNA modification methylase